MPPKLPKVSSRATISPDGVGIVAGVVKGTSLARSSSIPTTLPKAKATTSPLVIRPSTSSTTIHKGKAKGSKAPQGSAVVAARALSDNADDVNSSRIPKSLPDSTEIIQQNVTTELRSSGEGGCWADFCRIANAKQLNAISTSELPQLLERSHILEACLEKLSGASEGVDFETFCINMRIIGSVVGKDLDDSSCRMMFGTLDHDNSGRIDGKALISFLYEHMLVSTTASGASSKLDESQLTSRDCTGGPENGNLGNHATKTKLIQNSGTALLGSDLSGHPLRSLSVKHISTDIVEKLVDVGLSRSATIHDIEPPIIRAAGAKLICPRDGVLGAAYVDSIRTNADDVGLASIMLSYTWGYSIGDIADTLSDHCSCQHADISRMYVWMCCFCINQHRVKTEGGKEISFDYFREEFGERVRSIGHILSMMQPWRNPTYIRRVWCAFELYTATATGTQVTIAMPPREADDFLQALQSGCGVEEMWQALEGVDVAAAEASVVADKVNILRLIEESPGFHNFNVIVTKELQQWIVRISEENLQRQVAMGNTMVRESLNEGGTDKMVNLHNLIQLEVQVGNLQLKVGHPGRAVEIFERACVRLQENGQANSKYLPALLRCVGSAKLRLHDLDGAEAAYTASRAIEQSEDKVPQLKDWHEHNSAGNLKLQRGFTQGALQDFQMALDLFGNSDEQPTALMIIWGNIGNAQTKLKKFEAAQESYKQARGICEKHHTLFTPEGATLLCNIGNLANMRNDMDSSVAAYTEARQILEKLGTLESPIGGSLLVNLAIALGRSGKFERALQCAEHARSIFVTHEMLETPLCAKADQIIDMAKESSAVGREREPS